MAVLALGCDSRATASDPQAGGARSEQKSKEYESCAATRDCQDDLRCFDQVCRRTARSVVGDYHAALGAAARQKGELEPAIAAYAAALGHYDAEKLALPPDIDCAYGATLAAARAKKEHAELAARVLHRCLLALPPGSPLRDQALAQLATLSESGLDPLLLGASKVADLYLTKAPQKPSADKLAVTVSANPTPNGKQFPQVTAKLDELKPALVACWEKHNAATKKDELATTLSLKVAYVQNPDFEDVGSWATRVEVSGGGNGEADACVKAAVEPALKSLKLTEATNTKLTITIK